MMFSVMKMTLFVEDISNQEKLKWQQRLMQNSALDAKLAKALAPQRQLKWLTARQS